MLNHLRALTEKFDSPVSHLVVCSLGSAVAASAATVFYLKTRPHILDLSKDGYQALINDVAQNFRVSNQDGFSFKITPEL